MDKIIKSNLRFLLLIWAISLFSTAYAQDNLTVKWGDTSGFNDITTLPTPNATSWDITSGTRQIRITASFANVNTAGVRTITAIIPRGFKIVAYNAKDGTQAISGVDQIGLSNESNAKLNSSTLTAWDGSLFANQSITGYTGVGTSADTPYKNMDGKIVYDCNSQCDNIELTLTLTIDQMLLPYSATSAVLPDISVSMSNTTSSPAFNKELALTVTATGLLQAALLSPSPGVLNSGSSGRQIAGAVDPSDPTETTGTVPVFVTGISYGAQYISRHYAETDTFKTSYPLGVQYQGFDLGGISNDWWQVSYPTAFSDGLGGTKSYSNGHLTVSVDLVNRIVTYAFKNTCNSYTGGINPLIRSYWTATVDGASIKWTTTGTDNPVNFVTNMTETGGALISNPQKRVGAVTNTVSVYMAKPKVSITLIPTNRTIRDLNATTGYDYPYNQSLGAFSVNNAGPTQPANITYTFDFPDNPQVKGVSIPAGQTSDATITANGKTNTGKTVSYSGTPARGASTVQLTPQMLNLPNGEYLTQLKITQNTLAVAVYNASTAYNAINYFGKWVSGQVGDVTVTITDANDKVLDSKTDHTTIGWNNVASGTLTTLVQTPSGNAANTFYPGQTIYFTSNYVAGTVASYTGNAWDVVDPDIYINLPTGIDLNVGSVSALSAAGNHGSTRFPLRLESAKTISISGADWTSYHFQVANPLDIIALSQNQGNPTNLQTLNITYTANISSACNAYPVLAPSQIFQIDLGQTAVRGLSLATVYAVADASNLAGKGTGYMLSGAVDSPNFSVVKKPGLQVYLGIKTAGTSQNYYTYNGTAATIAAVSRDVHAEVWLKYENTSNVSYYAGSEIYLPIPKNGTGYDHFFNNASTDSPAVVEDGKTANKAPQWTSELTTEVSLPGFDTYYGISNSTTTNYTSSNIAADWVPVTMDWYPPSGLPAGKSLSDVTMLKLVANQNIDPAGQTGCTGEATFELSVAPDAQLEQYNYWRSYQKGWLDDAGAGTWVYGSVLAASPAMSGVEGLFFKDGNMNGVLDAGEKFNSDMPNTAFTASLMGPGITTQLMMKINTDGSFKSLNTDNSTFYLTAGTYTITINNTLPDSYHFTTFYPAARSSFDASNKPVWMNDIPLSGIRTDNISATITFTVTPLSTTTQLVGIGLKDVPKYIMVNPHAGGRVVFSK